MRLVVVEQLADLLLQLVPVLLTELLAAQLLPAVELGHGSLHYPHVLHLQHLIIDIGPKTNNKIRLIKCSRQLNPYLSPPHRLSMQPRYNSLAEARLTKLLASIVTSNIDLGSGIVFPCNQVMNRDTDQCGGWITLNISM